MKGKTDIKSINIPNVRMFKAYCNFIRPVGECCDISPMNAKMDYIKNHFQIEVDQVDSEDYNFDELPFKKKYDTIFCFSVIGCLIRPDWLLVQIRDNLKDGGRLYLSTPARPRFLWNDNHFHEIGHDKLKDWLLDPIRLKIVSKGKIRLYRPWYKYFMGWKPFMRLFFDFCWIYEIVCDPL